MVSLVKAARQCRTTGGEPCSCCPCPECVAVIESAYTRTGVSHGIAGVVVTCLGAHQAPIDGPGSQGKATRQEHDVGNGVPASQPNQCHDNAGRSACLRSIELRSESCESTKHRHAET